MDFSQQGRNPSKKFGGLAFVILLHVLIVYALFNGLARKVVEVVKGPIETKIIKEEVRPPPENLPPPPPPPKMVAPPPPFIPPPEVAVQTQQAPTIAQTTAVAPAAPFTPPVRRNTDQTGVRTAAIANANACKPEYPARALRDELEGTTIVAFLIGTDGRVADSRIEKSSGSKDLDNAAKVGLGRCKFTPGTIDGVPQESWTKVTYVWKLD
ncbi:MAG: energy transducer TonB [Paucimonas sp.]|jgi:protein TonB|nr:energy transducer TonB [Paucimonas sp.]